jgi:hypothetical protein
MYNGHVVLITSNFSVWDKASIVFIICFGFRGFKLLNTLNSYDLLRAYSLPNSIKPGVATLCPSRTHMWTRVPMPVEGPRNELVKNRMPQPFPLFMQSIMNYVSTRQCSIRACVRACGIVASCGYRSLLDSIPPPLMFHASISQ